MEVRIVCGRFRDTDGPVEGVAANPTYLDVTIPAGLTKTFPVDISHNAFAYVFSGSGKFGDASKGPSQVEAENRCLVLFDGGDEVTVQVGSQGIRFLLVAGKPLREPVAWNGPIVMNTQSELRQAFLELEEGTFLAEVVGRGSGPDAEPCRHSEAQERRTEHDDESGGNDCQCFHIRPFSSMCWGISIAASFALVSIAISFKSV